MLNSRASQSSHFRGQEAVILWCTRSCSIFLGAGLLTIASLGWASSAAVAQLSVTQSPNSVLSKSEVEVLLVNPVTGDDTNGTGTEQAPFKTITQALQVAGSNTVILLSPGVYSTQTGEIFPLRMKPGVTIQGNPRTRGQDVVIEGGGSFKSPSAARQDITILGADQAGLRGVTVVNPNKQGYGLWIESSSPLIVDNTFTGNTKGGISLNGDSAPTIRSNYFYDNGGNGITVNGTLQPEMRENVFEDNGLGTGFADNSAPQLIGHHLISNHNGQAVESNAQSVLLNGFRANSEPEQLAVSTTSSPALETLTEPSDNQLRENDLSPSNTQIPESTIVNFGEQLDEGTESSLDLTETDNLTSQATTEETNRQLPSPPTVTEQSTQSESLALNSTENVAEELVTTTTTNKADIPSESVVTATEIAPTSADNSPVENTPETLAQNEVLEAQPVAEVEPETAAISAASFPVPSMLSSQTSATASAADVTPAANLGSMAEASAPEEPPQENLEANASFEETAGEPTDVIEFNEPLQSNSLATSPDTQTTSSLAQLTPTQSEAPQAQGISIPVPSPNSTSVESNPVPKPAQSSTTDKPSNSPPSELEPSVPVLNSDPQSDSAGQNFPRTDSVPVFNDNNQQLGNNNNRTTLQGLRYRVLVEAQSEEQQNLLKSLVPDAFRTVVNGKAMMQAGIFSTRETADQVWQMLNSKGLNATIEQLE